MPYQFSQRSLDNLKGVHSDLQEVAHKALDITSQDFTITEGLRARSRQRELYKQGKTQTMDSRHLTGHAIDIVPYPVNWEFDYFYPVADAFRKAAQELDIPLRLGLNWNVTDIRRWNGTAEMLHKKYKGNFADGPHIELPRRYYP